jgi:hypothetical protein
MNFKVLLLGIVAIVLLGVGGLVYRNAVERAAQPIACPVGALVCPDGTSVMRIGSSCTFPVCPPPNITLSSIAIAFALPQGFGDAERTDPTTVAVYTKAANASSTNDARISIRQYPITASSTALSIIQETAIGDPSGLPVSPTGFTSSVLGSHRFTEVDIGRFEGVVDTAYYLARGADVLRFDAIDMNVSNWTDPQLDKSTLPAHSALLKLLSTLQGQ